MLSISSCVCWPFVYLLWRNVCLDLSSIFWFGCLLVWYWAVLAACIFWRLILCQLFHLQIFLWGLPFHLAYSFPLLCKAFKFNYFTFISVFIFIILGGGSKSILQWFMSECSTYVFCKSFIISGLTFRFLIHFEFIFENGVRKCSNFILLYVAVQFCQHSWLSFLHCIFLPPLSKIRWP